MRAIVLLCLAGALAGCGTNDDRNQARQVVERFYEAVRGDRAHEACELISQGLAESIESATEQSCEGVITRFEYEGAGVERVQVYVTTAKVDLDGGESAYLDRGPAGWQLTAIACKPGDGDPVEQPMDCEAEA